MKRKSVYIPRSLIEESLKEKPVKGVRLLEPLKSFAADWT